MPLSLTFFNSAPPTVMHVDINSCFATCEQQANPLLRGIPVVVAAYAEDHGCILAASREAKKIGIKTGMRVFEAKHIYPRLVVLPPDPEKYRHVNHLLTEIAYQYTPDVTVASIDELSLILGESPIYLQLTKSGQSPVDAMKTIARRIKNDIQERIGVFITVSIGIGPNWYLAKTASNLHKPDGLDAITKETIEEIFRGIELTDLTGIKEGSKKYLYRVGITTALGFYRAPIETLRAAFASVEGCHWWLKLHGWDDQRTLSERKTIGHSLALKTPYETTDTLLLPILRQLTDKTGRRLRRYNQEASGIGVSCLFDHHEGYWQKTQKTPDVLWTDLDLFRAASHILRQAPTRAVRILSVHVYSLSDAAAHQESLFETDEKNRDIIKAVDAIRDRWGEGALVPGTLLQSTQRVLDRIAFGRSGLAK